MALARSLALRRTWRAFPLGRALRLALASAAVFCLATLTMATAWQPAASGAIEPRSIPASASGQAGPSVGAVADRGQSGATSPSRARGSPARPWLGVTAQDFDATLTVTDEASADLPAPSVVRLRGAVLVAVVPGGPADDAQLQGIHYLLRRSDRTETEHGDVVIGIDGYRVKSADDLASYVAHSGKHVGDTVTLRIVRADQVFDVLVRLRARDDSQADQLGAL